MKPLAIDLFCGLGGWTEGLLAEGYRVIGFDIERRPYPAQLVLQDVTTINGRQFRDATLIVASPPCQAYSYRAMPWKRAKALPPPDNTLFEACFRIQREASEAAGRYIPMVVENVRGAQKWVGRAQANFGSYYLWGDVAMVGRKIVIQSEFGTAVLHSPTRGGQKFNPDGTAHGTGIWFKIADSKKRGARGAQNNGRKGPGGDWFQGGRQGQDACIEAIKNNGGSWFNIAHNKDSGKGRNARDLKAAGVKQHGSGAEWFDRGIAKHSSHSNARKHASALIAKIPFPLAQFVAQGFKPHAE